MKKYTPVCIISHDFEHEIYSKSSLLGEENPPPLNLGYKICPKCIFRGARSLVITDIIILFPGRVPPPPEALINFIRYCWHQKLKIVCARRGGGQFQRLPRAPLFLDTPLMERHVLEQGSGSKPPEALGPWKWPYVIGIKFSKHN